MPCKCAGGAPPAQIDNARTKDNCGLIRIAELRRALNLTPASFAQCKRSHNANGEQANIPQVLLAVNIDPLIGTWSARCAIQLVRGRQEVAAPAIPPFHAPGEKMSCEALIYR